MRDDTPPRDDYVLARNERETERLRAQARIWEPMTAEVLASAGLRPGMRCLDVGCGPGEVMRLMGKTVGPSGEVVGLDLDAQLGRAAVARLSAEGGARYRFEAGDITAGTPVAGAPFDLVFARFLLIHMDDPVAVTRRLGGLVRPGGTLVLMDFDLRGLAVRPEEPVVERGFEIVNQCFARAGKRFDMGTRLGACLLAAGLPHPEGFAARTAVGPLAEVGEMLRTVLASIRDAAQALGVAEGAEVDRVREDCRTVGAERRHFGIGPTLHGVWTRLPGRG